MQGEEGRGEVRHDMAELGSAQRKHRFVYSCVITRTCFKVTVLAWHKYTTILFNTLIELQSYEVLNELRWEDNHEL
jgi:hypothetical protein